MEKQEKTDRLIEAASAVLVAAPEQRLNVVVLNKALFYLDLAILRDSGTTLTGCPYIAIQKGPVVAKYPSRLVGSLTARGIAEQLEEWDGSKPVVLKATVPDFRYLDAPARDLASRVARFFGRMTSTQASDYSHENPGWMMAWAEYKRLGKPCAINMRIAMQQILEEDPWMDQPIGVDEEVLAAADAELGEDW